MIDIRMDSRMLARLKGLTNLVGYDRIDEEALRRVIAGGDLLMAQLRSFLPGVEKPHRRRSKADGDGYVLPQDMGGTGT